MAVTGRLALLVALGALVVGLLVPSLLGVLVVSGALALLAVGTRWRRSRWGACASTASRTRPR